MSEPSGRPLGAWALVVIDMQNDFLHRDGYYASRRDHTTHSTSELRDKRIATLIDGVRLGVRIARDRGRPIAFVRAVYDRSFPVLPPSMTRYPNRRDFPCKPGTWGMGFIEPVAELIRDKPSGAKEVVIDKHTYDAFHETPLNDFLANQGTETIVVCGTETHVCVLASAQHGAFLGYLSMIVEDAIWSPDATSANAALAIFRSAYGDTLRLGELSVRASPPS